jgi:uncharacterized protein YbjT (DUF2867 family)
MRVVIAGGHGKVATRLVRRLVARGVSVVSLIRDPEQAEDVRGLGAQPVVCDLERVTPAEVDDVLAGSDAVVFAAGAGPGSGRERKLTVDRDGAIKLLAAAASAGVSRYLMVSSVGAENPPDRDDVFSVYLRAKAEADAAVESSDRDWTIVRPGRLTDDPGSERVRIDTEPFGGEIPREDLAAILDALLEDARTARMILYVSAGEQTVAEALAACLAARAKK